MGTVAIDRPLSARLFGLPPTLGINEYKTYTRKLMNNDTMGQMWDGPRILGTVYTVNGQTMFAPVVPEPEASKVKKAIEEWKASGKTGSRAPPAQPICFEPDGGATVPLKNGSTVHFSPSSVEIIQANALATIPGKAHVQDFKVEFSSPNVVSVLFRGSSKIYINNQELKPHGYDIISGRSGDRKAAKIDV